MSLTRHIPVTWDVDVLGTEGRLPVVARPSPTYFGALDASMDRMYNEMRQASALGPDAWRLREDAAMDNPIIVDQSGNRKYRLQFDLRHFKPEEISIKTNGSELIVTARHEEIGEGRAVSREYNRKYTLPSGLKAQDLTSRLSPEGLLTVEAPLPALSQPPPKQETVIPIQHCPK